MKPRVLEEPGVVGDADVSHGGAPEARVREREPEALEERVHAKHDEEGQPGREEEVSGPGLAHADGG